MTNLQREESALGEVLRWADPQGRSILCTGRRVVLRRGRRDREVASHPWPAVIGIATAGEGSRHGVILEAVDTAEIVADGLDLETARSLVETLEAARARGRSRSPMSVRRVLSGRETMESAAAPRSRASIEGWRPPRPVVADRKLPLEQERDTSAVRLRVNADGETLLVPSYGADAPWAWPLDAVSALPGVFAGALLWVVAVVVSAVFVLLAVVIGGGMLAVQGVVLGMAFVLALGLIFVALAFAVTVSRGGRIMARAMRHGVSIRLDARGAGRVGGPRWPWGDVDGVRLVRLPRRHRFAKALVRVELDTREGSVVLCEDIGADAGEIVARRIRRVLPDPVPPSEASHDDAAALADLAALRARGAS